MRVRQDLLFHCDQLRALDLQSRHARKLETVPFTIVQEVLVKVLPIFE